MNKDEIKQQYTMLDILTECGLSQPNRAGFISCPFHKGDRQASLKISKDFYYCFACGVTGDIFSFIQEYYNCDFRTAFQMLGGTYEKPNFKSDLAIYKARKAKEMKLKEERKLKNKKQLNCLLISVYRKWLEMLEPYSDAWCDCVNELEKQLNLYEIINQNRRVK